MTKREELEQERGVLVKAYEDALKKGDEEEMKLIVGQGMVIRRQLDSLCYVCHNEERSYNEYYCSPECNDVLYPPEKVRPNSTEGFKKKLEEWKNRERKKK